MSARRFVSSLAVAIAGVTVLGFHAMAAETPVAAPGADGAIQIDAAAPKGATPAAADEKKICRIESVTGSRISRQRICRTAKQWRDDRQASHDMADEVSRRSLSMCLTTPGMPCPQ
ncbi:MAG: hypothetical protein NW200_02405 [Hyphomonadaceae bacterium]|nr:hypothetical protein [Hyphomonadaceae bacterium]